MSWQIFQLPITNEMFSFSKNYFLFYFSFIVLIIFLSVKWISTRLKTKKNLPPSPPKLPIIGNLHQLGLSPHRSLRALSRKHGPLMSMHFGSVPVLVASSPEAAKEIMKTHDLKFCNRPKLRIVDIVVYGSNDITFSPYGEYWRQVKSIAVVHLLNTTRVQSFRQTREEEVGLMIDMIEKSSGSVVDLSELLFRLVNNIVCKAALGRTYPGSKFADLLERFVWVLGAVSLGSYIPWLSWVDKLSGLEGKAHKVAKDFDDFLEGVVAEHVDKRRGMDVHAQSGEDQDLVDILLDVKGDNTTGFTFHRNTVKALILDVFAAGTDTTFASLVWSISELLRHPRAMEKLKQEVTKIAQGRSMILEKDLENMQYLKAVIKETLRMYPPIPLLIPHESTEDVKLLGYDIPAGTQTLVNAWAIGRDPTAWEEPEEFKPERFLNSSTDYKGLHYELLPFGGGRRGCPGIPFATVIFELALANVIYKFDLALPNGVKNTDLDMREKFGITLHKEAPLLVMATTSFK
ncbi:cytochrome P450 Tp4149 [Lactuca sativa]|uniref:cytochrome P450 Tp4149 n=1 Tax=Lactuca sativa TaxID=4236 RepID=UPI000CD992FD|nr:cytochrome P450 Tp4149 [Lactuca sativa]